MQKRLFWIAAIVIVLLVTGRYTHQFIGKTNMVSNDPSSSDSIPDAYRGTLDANPDLIRSYEAFRKYCEINFFVTEHLYHDYQDPLKEEFQVIYQNPEYYLSMVKKLMADETVSVNIKNGVSATMMGLPIDQLADFVDYLNELDLQGKETLGVALSVVRNPYREASAVKKTKPNFTYDSLFDHSDRPEVKRVFKNLYDNPHLPIDEREEGSEIYRASH